MIEQKMAQLPTRRIGAYLRKMAIDGYIIYTDTADIKAMNKELLSQLFLPLDLGIDVSGLKRPDLWANKDRLDHVLQEHFQRLSISLIHGEEEEGQHSQHHPDGSATGADSVPKQKEQRYADQRRCSETNDLPFGQAKQHFGFDICQVLVDCNVKHFTTL